MPARRSTTSAAPCADELISCLTMPQDVSRASLYHGSAMLSRLRPTLSRRWLVWAAGGAAVLVAGLVVALNSRGGGDIFNADVPFRLSSPPVIPRTPPAARREGRFTWAVFGFGKTRTRYLPTNKDLGPPYDQRWAFRGSVLLEFPPILGSHSVYLLRNNGSLYAFGRKTGRLHWRRKVGFAVGLVPGVRAQHRVRHRPEALQGLEGRPRRGDRGRRRAHPVVAAPGQPHRVVTARGPRQGCTSGRRTAPSTPWTLTTARSCGGTGPAAP